MLAQTHKAADVGMHLGDLVVSGTLKGCNSYLELLNG